MMPGRHTPDNLAAKLTDAVGTYRERHCGCQTYNNMYPAATLIYSSTVNQNVCRSIPDCTQSMVTSKWTHKKAHNC